MRIIRHPSDRPKPQRSDVMIPHKATVKKKTEHRPQVMICLDIGQATDHTARCVFLFQPWLQGPDDTAILNPHFPIKCIELHQYPIHTKYTNIVSETEEVYNRLSSWKRKKDGEIEKTDKVVIIDNGQAGRAVAEMFNVFSPIRINITGGYKPNYDEDTAAFNIPKADLVGAMQFGMQSGRMQFLKGLKFAPILIKEFANFKMKPTAAGNVQFEARVGENDDLLLSAALGAWWVFDKKLVGKPLLWIS